MPVFATALLLVSGFAAYSLLHTTSLVLDASTGRYTLDQGGPVVWTPLSGDLASILRATVETDNGGQRFVLVMKNGQRMGLGSFNDKGGQSEAAVAVNRFLHVEDAGQ